jgi:HEAT repeat protein
MDTPNIISLLGAVTSDDEAISVPAAKTLGQTKWMVTESLDLAVAALCRAVKEGTDKLCHTAMSALSSLGCLTPEVIDTWLFTQRSANAVVRWKLASILGTHRVQTKAALECLIELCQDDNGNTRRAAARSLLAMADDNELALHATLPLLTHDDAQIRRVATSFLSRPDALGPAGLVALFGQAHGEQKIFLLKLLTRTYPRANELFALFEVCLQSSDTPLVLEALHAMHALCSKGLELESLKPHVLALLQNGNGELRWPLFNLLEQMGFVPFDLAMLLEASARWQDTSLQIRILERWKTLQEDCELNTVLLELAMPGLCQLLGGYDSDVRFRVAELFGAIGKGNEAICGALTERLNGEYPESEAYVRLALYRALWQVEPEDEILLTLFALGLKDLYDEIRRQTLVYLADMGERAARLFPDVQAVLENEQEQAHLLAPAALAMAQMDERAADVFVGHLLTEVPGLRRAVVEGLRLMGSPSVKALVRTLETGDERLQAEAMFALSEFPVKDREGYLGQLCGCLTGASSWVRYYGMLALMGTDVAAEQVEQTALSCLQHDDWHVQAAALEWLATRPDVTGVPASSLFPFVTHEQDDVRACAWLALAVHATPSEQAQWQDALIAALNDPFWEVREAAATAAGWWQEPGVEVHGILHQLALDPFATVRAEAEWAMAQS